MPEIPKNVESEVMNREHVMVAQVHADNRKCIATECAERLDLQFLIDDKTLSIHKQLKLVSVQPEYRAQFQVIDLTQVYIDATAKFALSRCYITPAFLLSKFGAHYAEKILTVGTRGKLKGVTYVDSSANVYLHSTDDGVDIVVSGVCGERDGKLTREIHISCASSSKQSVVASADPTQ